jgi:ribosome-binding protein aMBF1 (putative translation factor)
MSPEQCRAARAWLGWSMDTLAARAHVSNSTVRDFEARRRTPIANNLSAMRGALEGAGIEFLSSDGIPQGIVFNGDALAGEGT